MSIVTLVIDMQVDFFQKDLLARMRPQLVVKTNELVGAARRVGVPIIWVKQEFSADLSDASLEVRRERIEIVISGTPGAELLPELDVRPSDAVIVKKRYSAFFGTDLEQRLKEARCSKLIVAGINTHACIRATVVDAYQRDIEVLLARDCIASHDEEHDRITWRYMDGKLGSGLRNDALSQLLGGERTA
ncbi:MAG TPA: isochorismatase family cysteine hydrolase [Steroidobacteraceae bacterium]|nr:isochorismatase family cysteine hydrolase [Steroidobacteraceae bacterium]